MKNNDPVADALASFRRLNAGEPAPHVEVQVDGHHMTASWVQTLQSNDHQLSNSGRPFRFLARIAIIASRKLIEIFAVC